MTADRDPKVAPLRDEWLFDPRGPKLIYFYCSGKPIFTVDLLEWAGRHEFLESPSGPIRSKSWLTDRCARGFQQAIKYYKTGYISQEMWADPGTPGWRYFPKPFYDLGTEAIRDYRAVHGELPESANNALVDSLTDLENSRWGREAEALAAWASKSGIL